MSSKKTVSKKKAPAKGVTKADLDEMQKSIGDLASVVESLAKLVTTPSVDNFVPAEAKGHVDGAFKISGNSPEKDAALNNANDGGPTYERTPLPEKYYKTVDKYFDRADGFQFYLDELNFSIVVPNHLSNMQDAYKLLYKSDIRTKVLPAHNFEAGIDAWCRMVVKNLKYDRNAARK